VGNIPSLRLRAKEVSIQPLPNPRFNEDTLLCLPVSQRVLKIRAELSHQVEESVSLYRQCEEGLLRAIKAADAAAE
jgi:hypothetical protein